MELTNKAKILILSSDCYDLLNEQKQRVSGITIYYTYNLDLKPCMENGDMQHMGVKPGKAKLELDQRAQIINVPGIYEGEFRMKMTSKNKAELELVDVNYICDVPDYLAKLDKESKAIKTA